MIKVFICFLLLPSVLFCQIKELPPKVKVMTLGVFHFNFPNLDVKKTEDKDKIDVYEEKYQKEINKIVMSLKEFRPTKIAIEVNPSSQKKIDSLYLAYKMNNHKLSRNEVQQLAFRLGKELAHTKLYCVDDWGKLYENLNYLFDDTSSRAKTFEYFYFNNPDSIFNSTPSHSDESKGIVFNLLDLNNPQKIKESLGPYLIGHFKYEENENDFTGVDFETGRWFNRNLRIFRNIQRLKENEDDRILVIFGGGHLNVLNYLFDASPEFELVSPIPYLNKIK